MRPIIIATPPRTASMWIWNIARGLLLSDGKAPIPSLDGVGGGKEQLQAMLDRVQAPNEVVCYKTHYLVPLEWDVRIITCVRDIREALASFMRFLPTTFNKACRAAAQWMMHCDYYLGGKDHTNLLRLNYVDVVAEPRQTIKSIAAFIGVIPLPDVVEQLHLRYERGAIRRYMAQWPKPETGRAMEPVTGFQTGHVAPEGYSWRDVLSESEQKRINIMSTAWRDRHNIRD